MPSGQRSGILLNTLQCPSHPPPPPQQRMTQPQMSIMPRFRNLALGIKEVNMGRGLRDLVPHGKLSFAKDIYKKSFTKSK